MNACQKRIEELLAEQPTADKTARPERGVAAGDGGGPGNPFGRCTARLREAMVSVVTEEDMQAVMRKMLAMAAAGSIPAMRLVMQYVIGKPTAAPNPDRVQIDEWTYYKETAAMTDDVAKVVKSLEPEAALSMGRDIRPIMSELTMAKYAKQFQGMAAPNPQPPAPEYRGDRSFAPAGDFDGESRCGAERETASDAPPGSFDGGESNTPHPQPLAPEYRGDGSSAPLGFDGDGATAAAAS